MGFDPSNIAETNRDENYQDLILSGRRESQKEKILRTLSIGNFRTKGATPSELYLYYNQTNGGEELYPYTSIRARLSEMSNPKYGNPKLNEFENNDKDRLGLYGKPETTYKIKEIKKIELKLF